VSANATILAVRGVFGQCPGRHFHYGSVHAIPHASSGVRSGTVASSHQPSGNSAPAPELVAAGRLSRCHANHLSSCGKRTSFAFHRPAPGSGVRWLRRLPAAEAGNAIGIAMSEGMLARHSNSKAGIRRTWMGPPPELPPSRTMKPILISLHCTRYDGMTHPVEAAHAMRSVILARARRLSRQGKVGLPNDDGVANANTPSSSSQSLGSDNRRRRLERAPKP
jgi:hypothetical protein